MAARVAAHRRAGHVVALLTSATRYLAEPLGADLGIDHLLVTQLVVREGRFTGEVVQPVCYGRGKVYWAERFAAEHGVDLDQSYFYTDSITDLPVLDRVGHPRVVHPDPRLRRLAQQRGWQVLRPSARRRVRGTGGARRLRPARAGCGAGGERKRRMGRGVGREQAVGGARVRASARDAGRRCLPPGSPCGCADGRRRPRADGRGRRPRSRRDVEHRPRSVRPPIRRP